MRSYRRSSEFELLGDNNRGGNDSHDTSQDDNCDVDTTSTNNRRVNPKTVKIGSVVAVLALTGVIILVAIYGTKKVTEGGSVQVNDALVDKLTSNATMKTYIPTTASVPDVKPTLSIGTTPKIVTKSSTITTTDVKATQILTTASTSQITTASSSKGNATAVNLGTLSTITSSTSKIAQMTTATSQTIEASTIPSTSQTTQTTKPTTSQKTQTTTPTTSKTTQTSTTPSTSQTTQTSTTPSTSQTTQTSTTPSTSQTTQTSTTPSTSQTTQTSTTPSTSQTTQTSTTPSTSQTSQTTKTVPSSTISNTPPSTNGISNTTAITSTTDFNPFTPISSTTPKPTFPLPKSVIQEGSWYIIMSVADGQVWDVYGNLINNGAEIGLWPYLGQSNQHFRFNKINDKTSTIEVRKSGKSVIYSPSAGTLQQWVNSFNSNEIWNCINVKGQPGVFQIQSPEFKKCVFRKDNDLGISDCTADSNTYFRLIPVCESSDSSFPLY